MDVNASDTTQWWHVPATFVLAFVVAAEIWGAVALSGLWKQASRLGNGGGSDWISRWQPMPRVPRDAVRAYDPIILGGMQKVVPGGMTLLLLASPAKNERRLASDANAGAISSLIVGPYIGSITDAREEPFTGNVTLTLIDAPNLPTRFLPFQTISSFVSTTHGTTIDTLFGMPS